MPSLWVYGVLAVADVVLLVLNWRLQRALGATTEAVRRARVETSALHEVLHVLGQRATLRWQDGQTLQVEVLQAGAAAAPPAQTETRH